MIRDLGNYCNRKIERKLLSRDLDGIYSLLDSREPIGEMFAESSYGNTSPSERKKDHEGEQSVISLETMLRGLCSTIGK